MQRALTLIVATAIASLFVSSAYAQGPGYEVPKIEDLVKIPPSPEAQAFTKYGNTQVNLYTGSPDISIPIANLQGRDISIPITLTYDASGIKVEQLATWVGLGWNLNVGGMVTRQVNGNPDDYMDANPPLKTFYNSTIKPEYDFVNGFSTSEGIPTTPGNLTRYFTFLNSATRTDIQTFRYEIQPDTYSFNALGISGTMYIDYTLGIAYCMEHPEIKGYPTFQDLNSGGIKNITEWKIVDGTGNSYYFELAERTYTYEQDANDTFKDYNSAWMLTRVESVNKRDIILFNYSTPAQWLQDQLAGRGEMRNEVYQDGTACGNDSQIPAPVPLYKITQAVLTSIQVNGLTLVQFISSAVDRKDLKGRKFLWKINLLDENSSVTKKYKFVRSYFGDSTQTDEKLVRLRLDALELYGENSSTVGERYEFTYEPGELPSRESMAQDFWGYYTGRGATTLIPRDDFYDSQNLSFSGADRTANFETGKIGSLVKIKYPTGGTTEFNFRAHESETPVVSTSSAIVPGYASLLGGQDNNDPFGYIACDDQTNIPPKGVDVAFYVATTQSLNITMVASGSDSPGLQMQYVAIYPVTSHGSATEDPAFCDVLNGSVTKIVEHYGTLHPSTTNYGLFTFNQGYYRIMILNTNQNLTVTVSVSGTTTNEIYEVGGQRIASIIDRDEYGAEVSARYFYYGDLNTVPINTITRSLLDSSPQHSGSVHAGLNFEEPKTVRKWDETNGSFYTCGSILRFSSNRTKSSQVITYPVVSEVQFSSPALDAINGFTVSHYADLGDSYTLGYAKLTILNGKLTKKSVYDKSGTKVQEERSYYSQASVGGNTGFVFYSNSSSGKDTYVVSEIYNQPLGEYYMLRDYDTKTGSHCAWGGAATYPFGDIDFHDPPTNHPDATCHPPDGSGYPVNHNHPSYTFYVQLQGQNKNPWMDHGNLYGIVMVSYQNWNVLYCRNFSSDYIKIPYLYPRYLARTDSTVSVSYYGNDSLKVVSTNTYNITTHYQVTLLQTKDSKGDLRQWQTSYPHDLQAVDPGNPIWQSLIDQNRIAQVVKIEAKYGSPLKPDYVKFTTFKSIATANGTMIVPDIVQFSSGTGTLEDRIKYHQYDNFGNPSEVSKVNDVHVTYLWDFSKTFPASQVKNAAFNEVFFTSFENEEGGTSGDAHLGAFSRTGGYSKALTGLTPNKPYVLTYWQKSGGIWSLQTTTISASSATTYNISLTGQVDDVRFYPVGAQMATYTHRLGKGMTSATDPNSITTTYEYDALGRMIIVRDNDGNILKRYEYHLRGDVVNQY